MVKKYEGRYKEGKILRCKKDDELLKVLYFSPLAIHIFEKAPLIRHVEKNPWLVF